MLPQRSMPELRIASHPRFRNARWEHLTAHQGRITALLSSCRAHTATATASGPAAAAAAASCGVADRRRSAVQPAWISSQLLATLNQAQWDWPCCPMQRGWRPSGARPPASLLFARLQPGALLLAGPAMGQAESVPAREEAAQGAGGGPPVAPSALVIVGPSGVGKGTLINRLMEGDQRYGFSCSHTTRKPREGEVVSPASGQGWTEG